MHHVIQNRWWNATKSDSTFSDNQLNKLNRLQTNLLYIEIRNPRYYIMSSYEILAAIMSKVFW